MRKSKKSPPYIESAVRRLTTAQSFSRGHELYRAGANTNGALQGNLLTGLCEGTNEPYDRLTAEFDTSGIRDALRAMSAMPLKLCYHLLPSR
jgi:hypothetical protein